MLFYNFYKMKSFFNSMQAKELEQINSFSKKIIDNTGLPIFASNNM